MRRCVCNTGWGSTSFLTLRLITEMAVWALVAAGHHTGRWRLIAMPADLIEDQENGAVADGLYPVYA